MRPSIDSGLVEHPMLRVEVVATRLRRSRDSWLSDGPGSGKQDDNHLLNSRVVSET